MWEGKCMAGQGRWRREGFTRSIDGFKTRNKMIKDYQMGKGDRNRKQNLAYPMWQRLYLKFCNECSSCLQEILPESMSVSVGAQEQGSIQMRTLLQCHRTKRPLCHQKSLPRTRNLVGKTTRGKSLRTGGVYQKKHSILTHSRRASLPFVLRLQC